MSSTSLRILDAAANRAREGLRVLEDAARFCWDDAALTGSLKNLRHDLAAALVLLPMNEALRSRDTEQDVGTGIKTAAEFRRAGVKEIVTANAKRLTEALRTLEEFAKSFSGEAAGRLEQLRYRAYTLEKSVLAVALAADATERFRGVRLYVLLTESLCRNPWEDVLDEILGTWRRHPADVPGGVSPLCIQLREKNLADGELLRRARLVVKKCHAAGALAIINDRPDVAILSGADGVHVGQTDLSISACRHILGLDAIIGISTENIEQARQAVMEGATYIACGPMFPTTTKEKPRLAGPEYAAEAFKEIKLPLVAIGGIMPENAGRITRVGITCLAVSSAIVQSPQPGALVGQFLKILANISSE